QHRAHRQLQPVACRRGQCGKSARARQRAPGGSIRQIRRRGFRPLREAPARCCKMILMARRQRAALVAGSLLTLAALLPPLSRLADRRLSLRMLEEMLLLALVIPLLAYGAGPLLPRGLASWIHPVAGILALNVVLFGSQSPAVGALLL